MATPLEIVSDLRLAVEGEEVDIQSDGDQIVVDLPSLRAGRRLLAAEPLSPRLHPRTTRQLHDALREVGLSLDVRLTGDSIGQIGKGAHPGRLGALFRLDGVEVRPMRLLWSAARRRPLVTAALSGALVAILAALLVRTRRS